MNISKNEVDALNLLVNIEITPEDYQTKVSDVLENYRKRANIPGFRPGKVPMGLIKKQYGKAVLIEEINKFLAEFAAKAKCVCTKNEDGEPSL